mgnify:CR=1 FL=1
MIQQVRQRTPGSSPYTRGTLKSGPDQVLFDRFIPIHTGNSCEKRSRPLTHTVHPHTHGELGRIAPGNTRFTGSSPYTRGTLSYERSYNVLKRFIPIHTGNSYADTICEMTDSVHPHTHGELWSRDDKSWGIFGSSPYTRGTPITGYKQKAGARFIPIHTGNSTWSASNRRAPSVHPHTHGELENRLNQLVLSCGSSPYTRGTHPHACMLSP